MKIQTGKLTLGKLKIAKLKKLSHIQGGDLTQVGENCDPERSLLILHCPTHGNGNGNGNG